MVALHSIHTVVLLLLGLYLSPVLGSNTSTGGLLDVTAQLYGRTVYAEYIFTGFRGHWIGPFGTSDPYFVEYDGYLRAVQEVDVYDPYNKVRLLVKDCNGGFACLRTRWREDTHTGAEYNRYLQADWLDVDFESSTSPQYDVQFQWQILCEDSFYRVCYLGSRYYPDSTGFARIFGTNSYSMDTDWVEDHYATWYQFRLLVPDAKDQGMVSSSVTVCNLGTTNVNQTLTVRHGISGTFWRIEPSVVNEVKSGFLAALGAGALTNSALWLVELNQVSTFGPESGTKVQFSLRPGYRANVYQLTGGYGPYTVYGTRTEFREEKC